VSIPALGHDYPDHTDESNYTTLIEATETTDGLKVLYCIHGCGTYDPDHTITIPKLGETFGDTGLPVSPYEWPTLNPGETATIKADGTIIKYNINGQEGYALFYRDCNLDNQQMAQGPTGDACRNSCVVLKLENPILTSANIVNGRIDPIERGTLYKTADGEYYVFIQGNTQANNLNNGDASVASSNEWFHIVKPAATTNTSNNSNATTNSLGRKALALGGSKAGRTSSAPDMSLFSAKALLGAVPTKAPADDQDRNTEVTADAEADAARMARIIKWFYAGDTTAKVKFRSEWETNKDESNLDVWEFVQEKTTTSGDTDSSWQWALSNLPAYDDDGNMYTYYVIETAPTETAYDISYGNNGVTEESGDKTININNTQKVGAVEVTKSFSGIDALPAGFKITAAYTANGIAHTVELTTSTTGMTGSGTAADPYKWTISNLPIGTEVTFTESGYEATDYTVAVTGNGGTAAAANPAGTHSITNIYQRNVKVDIGILKIEKDKPDKILPGATFTLREINSVITASEPSYKDPDDSGIPATTNGEGEASFNDLEAGYYEVRETGVPAGYVLTGDAACYIRIADGSIEMIKVNATGNGWDVVNTAGNFEFAAASGTDNAKVTVSNEPGAALPNTGGPGTRLFTILGSILILGAGVLLWRRRRLI
jgi:LPXTG-motif cell wall-anchored protein